MCSGECSVACGDKGWARGQEGQVTELAQAPGGDRLEALVLAPPQQAGAGCCSDSRRGGVLALGAPAP